MPAASGCLPCCFPPRKLLLLRNIPAQCSPRGRYRCHGKLSLGVPRLRISALATHAGKWFRPSTSLLLLVLAVRELAHAVNGRGLPTASQAMLLLLAIAAARLLPVLRSWPRLVDPLDAPRGLSARPPWLHCDPMGIQRQPVDQGRGPPQQQRAVHLLRVRSCSPCCPPRLAQAAAAGSNCSRCQPGTLPPTWRRCAGRMALQSVWAGRPQLAVVSAARV